ERRLRAQGQRAHRGLRRGGQAAPARRPPPGGLRDLAGDRDGPRLPRRRRPRPGRCDGLRRERRPAVRHVGRLPPAHLVAPRPRPHGAPGPLDDLHPHRRHLHAVRAAAARGDGALGGVRRGLGRRPGRRRPAQHRPPAGPLAVRGAVPRARLGGRGGAAADPQRRGTARAGPPAGGRRLLHPGRRGLRAAPAGPLAPVVRLPRGLPRLHAAGVRHPLHRRVVRDVRRHRL
ncbi:MAG: FIG01964566: Predicted membrane protein, hemolysin III homolog, partial [uncultured Blastococcus sp.]